MDSDWWRPVVARDGHQLDIYSAMLADGIIFVNAPIDQRISGLIVSCLLQVDAHTDAAKRPKIYLNTKKGDIVSAMSVVDILERYKRKGLAIQTVGLGEIGVAAGLIVAAGSPGQRHLTANCQLSLYLGMDNLECTNLPSEEMKLRQGEKLKDQFIQLFAKYTKQDVELFRLHTNSEAFVDAETALQRGVCDALI